MTSHHSRFETHRGRVAWTRPITSLMLIMIFLCPRITYCVFRLNCSLCTLFLNFREIFKLFPPGRCHYNFACTYVPYLTYLLNMVIPDAKILHKHLALPQVLLHNFIGHVSNRVNYTRPHCQSAPAHINCSKLICLWQWCCALINKQGKMFRGRSLPAIVE